MKQRVTLVALIVVVGRQEANRTSAAGTDAMTVHRYAKAAADR
jgi:hypothetical protein